MTDYYVDPNGSNSNAGTSLDSPFADLRGASGLTAGDTVYVRGGTYNYPTAVDFTGLTGTSSSPITVTAYQNEVPVHDFSNSSDRHGIMLDNSQYVRLQGHEIRHAEMHNVRIFGNEAGSGGSQNVLNVTVEGCEIHGHGRGGQRGHAVFIAFGADGVTVRNCELYDGKSGGNSDGVAASDESRNTLVEDSVIHHNSDDGIDFGAGSAVPHDTQQNAVIRRCLIYKNGRDLNGNNPGDGYGIKTGNANQPGGGHRVVRVASFDNTAFGLGSPNTDVPMTLYNCTSVDNGNSGVILTEPVQHDIANCIVQGGPDWDLRLAAEANVTTCAWDESKSGSFNADNGSGVWVNFKSKDPTSSDFLRLPSGSPGIDAGTDVGVSFEGSAPDWGAFETDASGGGGGTTSATANVRVGGQWVQPSAVRYYDGQDWLAAPLNVYSGGSWVTAMDATGGGVGGGDDTGGGGTTIVSEPSDLSAFSGDAAYFDVTDTAISGSFSVRASGVEHGSYRTVASTSGLSAYPQAGDTIQWKVSVDTDNTYGAVLWGVQSELSPWPAYRLILDTGATPGIRFEKVPAGGPIESHNLPDGNHLSDTAFHDNSTYKPTVGETYTVEVQWGTDGVMPWRVVDSGGSLLAEDTAPAPDTEYQGGGVGFMSSSSWSGQDTNIARFDDYRIV